MHNIDRLIASVARRQRGVFNHDQVIRAGGTDKVIHGRIQAGIWLRVAPEVYALPSAQGDFLRQCWAATLTEPGSGIAGLAAAAIRRFPDFRPCHPEIVAGLDANARNPIATVHRYADPLLTTYVGLPITTPAQTFFDIAQRAGFVRTEAALDHELLAGRVTIEELDERLLFYQGTRRPGLPTMRALLGERRADGWTPPESELERRADKILRRLSGKPTIIRQATFPWLKRGKGRVDRYLPDDGIVVEIDGRRWHARLADFDKDRWRDNLVVAHGLIPMRFSYAHIVATPSDVLSIIEQTRRIRRAAA
jgi:very-short-patch-repair endonuclease